MAESSERGLSVSAPVRILWALPAFIDWADLEREGFVRPQKKRRRFLRWLGL